MEPETIMEKLHVLRTYLQLGEHPFDILDALLIGIMKEVKELEEWKDEVTR